jgi:HSP20 family molecular chaperone IbpA
MSSERQYGWMWDEACDLVDAAEQAQRRFLRYVGPGGDAAAWAPPVDIQEVPEGVVVVFALPGVALEDIELRLEPAALTVRAARRLKVAHPDALIRRLEIPHGRFIRRIALSGVPLVLSATRYEHGCLEVYLVRAKESDL